MVPHVSSRKLLPGSANKNIKVRVHVTTTAQDPQSAKRCDGYVCATKLELWQDLCKTQRSITVIESILLKTISRFKICLSFFLRLNCEFDKTCSETDSGTGREICC